MADSTPGVAKAVTGGTAALLGDEVMNILDPIIAHSWPWLATPGVLSSIEALIVAGFVFAATWIVPHQLGTQSPAPPSKS